MTTKTEQAGPSLGSNPGSPSPARSPSPTPRSRRVRPFGHLLYPNDEFDLNPLQDLAGSIPPEDLDSDSALFTEPLNIPTLNSVALINNHPVVKARRNEALEKGLKTIGKPHLMSAGLATRRLFKTTFPDELELLDKVLSQVQTRTRLMTGDKVYRLVIDDYELLLRVLFSRRMDADDSFRILGKSIPSMPSWGHDDDLEEFWSENDFEILGVCFRAEVEHFLYTLNRFYDFGYRRPRESTNPEITEGLRNLERNRSRSASAQPEPQFYQRSASTFNDRSEIPKYRSSSLFNEYVERKPFARDPSVGYGFGFNYGNYSLPKNNSRLNEILEPMSTIYESPHDYRGYGRGMTMEPEEADQFQRMNSRGNERERDIPPHMAGDRDRRDAPSNPRQDRERESFQRQGAPPDPPDPGDDDPDNGNGGYRRPRFVPPRRSGGRGDPPDPPGPNSGPDLVSKGKLILI
ncbi:hypothetical protein R3P38DRAFT_3223269 [Favolaschia claudopus]|uniref:Uncharacterized protein n=1 Tax=Favolaschia claudopus TaxID=2862362 RepID=A0AAV9ZXL3_9AGAR